MISQLKNLKNVHQQKNCKIIKAPIFLQETIKNMAKEFESVVGTGVKDKNIKSDITPCSWHWPRFCENMINKEDAKVLHSTDSTKKCCEYLDKNKIKYVKVAAGYESIYATAVTPIDTIIVYENYN
jgi:hypothetical protein